jgi:hypothetical protein
MTNATEVIEDALEQWETFTDGEGGRGLRARLSADNAQSAVAALLRATGGRPAVIHPDGRLEALEPAGVTLPTDTPLYRLTPLEPT